jgi:hypothetical protein
MSLALATTNLLSAYKTLTACCYCNHYTVSQREVPIKYHTHRHYYQSLQRPKVLVYDSLLSLLFLSQHRR